MSFSLKLIAVFFLAFIESVVFFLPLTAVFLALVAVYEENESVLSLSLLAGLLVDILQVRTLGTTSLLFLLIVFLIFLYKRKVIGKNPLFIGAVVFISSLSYTYLVLRRFEIQVIVLTFLTLVFLYPKSIRPIVR